jgi:rhamnulokinase
VRVILESLALKYRSIIDKINTMRGSTIDTLHVVGGGSQNEMLDQFTASATGLPVIAGPIEATALGNVIVQAVAKNDLDSIREGRDLVSRSFRLQTYEPKDRARWEDAYQKFSYLFESR